ncbi:MAG: hypothetical protein HY599_05720, partial [Candidatus Omnitrophica bacterium]|nr:hypothetical protein [Candidatus Omnitrophota bacterium]
MAEQSVPRPHTNLVGVGARDLVTRCVRDLTRRGAAYADARYEHSLHESLVAEDGHASSISLYESAGVGIRVLLDGSWGFAATPDLTRAGLARTATLALESAKASASLNRSPRALAPVEPVRARHTSRYAIDPFEVPLAQKLDYLLWANTTLLGPDAVQRATTH